MKIYIIEFIIKCSYKFWPIIFFYAQCWVLMDFACLRTHVQLKNAMIFSFAFRLYFAVNKELNWFYW